MQSHVFKAGEKVEDRAKIDVLCSVQSMASSSAAVNAATAETIEDVRVADPKCSRGFTYVMYEANAWQLKFAKSGQKIMLSPESMEKASLVQ